MYTVWNRPRRDDARDRTSPLEQAQCLQRSLTLLLQEAVGDAYTGDLAMTRIAQDLALGTMLAVRALPTLLGQAGNVLSNKKTLPTLSRYGRIDKLEYLLQSRQHKCLYNIG